MTPFLSVIYSRLSSSENPTHVSVATRFAYRLLQGLRIFYLTRVKPGDNGVYNSSYDIMKV